MSNKKFEVRHAMVDHRNQMFGAHLFPIFDNFALRGDKDLLRSAFVGASHRQCLRRQISECVDWVWDGPYGDIEEGWDDDNSQ